MRQHRFTVSLDCVYLRAQSVLNAINARFNEQALRNTHQYISLARRPLYICTARSSVLHRYGPPL